MSPSSLAALLLLVPLARAGAGEPEAPAVLESPASSLERALASISAPRISADLHFIASDELGGRDTPSTGQRIAARYIRARLQRLGWEPGAPQGYFYEYDLPMVAMDRAATRLAFAREGAEHTLALGRDWAFFPAMLAASEVSGEIVFGGTFGEEEAREIDVKGKWILCYSGDGDYRKRLGAARSGEAAGILVADDPAGPDEMAERCAGYAAQLAEPRLGRGGSRRRGIPYSYLTRSGLESLLRLAGVESPVLGQALGVTAHQVIQLADGSQSKLENVCGLWPGSDPKLREEVIIVSAHYDHVGRVEQTGEVFNGADDNGSGTCGLLALAEALSEAGPLRRTVMLMWVSGEEKGLLGSAAWTKNPWLPEGMRPVLDLNIDMIGRNAPNQILVTPTSQHQAYNFLTRLVEEHAPAEGFTDIGSADEYWSRSDHANFSQDLDLPVAFLFSDVHEDYHKPTDTPDKIDYDKLSRVVRLVLRMLYDLQGDSLAGE